MPIPKFVGDDCELSTTGRGPDGQQLGGMEVTYALLDHIGEAFLPYGLQVWTDRPHGNQSWQNGYGGATTTYVNRFDSNRNWLPNGGCSYCDCEKLEMATGATLCASRYAAQHIASLIIAERARQAVEAEAAQGIEVQITAENVDPQNPSASWGTHFNVSIAKSLWQGLHTEVRHPNVYSFVTSALAAATAMFGSGYLLPLQNGEVIYSLSARAPHLTKLDSLSTIVAFQRGILNSRREGFSSEERQHLINFDFSPAGARLRACLVQMIFAAAEEGYCGLNLFDPVKALRTWSFSLDMQSGRLPEPALLADGTQMTLPQYVRALCTVLLEMVESRLIGEDVVPEAAELLPVIIELTHQLDAGALAHCAKHLDWCVKILFLLNLCVDGGARFGDAATRLASFDYTNTNPQRGWFWKLWEAGQIDPLVSKEEVEQALATAPPESRAWGRAGILRRFHQHVAAVSWDHVTLLRNAAASRWSPRLKIGLPELDSLNRAVLEPILVQARDVDHLERLLRQRTLIAESEPAMEINTQLLLPDEA
ncbi:MAG: proteasome accessory factor PafA2 family protein [Thermoguttaceae bacterium]|jgi:proteasome accessory factor A